MDAEAAFARALRAPQDTPAVPRARGFDVPPGAPRLGERPLDLGFRVAPPRHVDHMQQPHSPVKHVWSSELRSGRPRSKGLRLHRSLRGIYKYKLIWKPGER